MITSCDSHLTLAGWTLCLGETLFHKQSTVVVSATVLHSPSHEYDGRDAVVKWNWAPKARTAESAFVLSARRRAERENPRMLDHLPDVFYAGDMESSAAVDIFGDIASNNFEERVLRVTVQERLKPLKDRTLTADELEKAFKAIFDCYRWLVEAAGILHRDISVNNLMYRRIDGQIYGVLNDFDLSQFINNSSGFTSDERIGTIPFMAFDLLNRERPPPTHLPRHDLESLMYALVFLVCEVEGTQLARWRDLGMQEVHDSKIVTLLEGFPFPKDGFERFLDWTYQLGELFLDAFGARTKARRLRLLNGKQQQPVPEVDDETLGGRLTFDTFASTLCEL
ncbi:hypothetical protein FB45DRAFT_3274 [Roridomyces roridus]|uniref:Protein kinase domain-containing protein n=1 Tax=Roridomyces roridus TaxID=1738132 RepID=A0AAD7FED4_9AGAR|nr:hypothetical protein FB45DRAFT_258584 [Roridomyces roridus]KAJ7649796.1 hypothetical protein FB45DRAFT_3274 [Roridomyces roridus]